MYTLAVNRQPSLLKKSILLLNAAGLPVLVLFFLDTIIFFLARELNFAQGLWGRLVILIFSVGQLLLYSGFCGVMVELASDEEPVMTWPRFTQNVRDFAGLCFWCLAGLMLGHFLSFILLQQQALPFDLYLIVVTPLVLLFLAHRIIQRKYVRPMALPSRRLKLTLVEIAGLVGVYLLHLLFFLGPDIFAQGVVNAARIGMFLVEYSRWLMFLLFVHLIIRNYPEIPKQFAREKELYLINLPGGGIVEHFASLLLRFYPPIFVILHALTPSRYRIKEFNRIICRDRYYAPGKLVAITCYTFNCADAYRIAKEFKKRGSRVVMGGPHVTYLADEALDYCDSVVIGDAEGVWPQIIADYEQGTLKPKYYGSVDEQSYDLVHQYLLKSPPAVIKDYLETTRGCKFKCEFCTIPGLSGGNVWKKPIDGIVELIKKIKHRYKVITFIDNNIYSDPAYAKELFAALKPLKIRWATCCTIDIAKNEETLQLAKESGCWAFLFGYEIFGDSVEKQQGGKFGMAERYAPFTKKIKEMGIRIKAHFIFGHDSDNWGHFWKLWKFCFSIKPTFSVVSLLTPLPGSKLYFDMLNSNRIVNLNWRNYSCHSMVVNHKHLNPALVNLLYPFFYAMTFFTTSSMGQVLLFIVICVSSIYLVAS